MKETRTVTIPARTEHAGFYSAMVTLEWKCPQCGGRRGNPYWGLSFDGSRRMNVHQWNNPCGHIDKYHDVRNEAFKNEMNRNLWPETRITQAI